MAVVLATSIHWPPFSISRRTVLLSPACASFDQYRDFEARGDHFRELVEALK